MPDNHLFEYAVIRVVPHVEREEFVNVGVVLYCAALRFLEVRYELNEQRLQALSSKTDVGEIAEYLRAFDHICKGSESGGAIAKLPMPERFRWLTATRSTVVQTSRVHPGLCKNAGETLSQLFAQMVSC
jgi:hypothetical protein